MRWLDRHGLGALPATTAIFLVATLFIAAARPHAVRACWRTPRAWQLALAAGLTNAAFNWGIVVGDVVRVVLLFYLMPVWAVVLGRLVLRERAGGAALLRVALALAGVGIVLGPQSPAGLPLPSSLGDWLGLAGGMGFAWNNILLRQMHDVRDDVRAFLMFAGGTVVAAVLAATQWQIGDLSYTVADMPLTALVVALTAACLLLGNQALQYGVTRLRANAAAVIMLTEVPFATASSAWLGVAVLSPSILAGAALILIAAALAARDAPGAAAGPPCL